MTKFYWCLSLSISFNFLLSIFRIQELERAREADRVAREADRAARESDRAELAQLRQILERGRGRRYVVLTLRSY